MKGRGLFQAVVVAGFAAAGCGDDGGEGADPIDAAAAAAADAAPAMPDAADTSIRLGCGCADSPLSCSCSNSPCCWLVEDPCCSVCPP